MCKNMIRTGIFNLTSMDIDTLGYTSEGGDRVSSLLIAGRGLSTAPDEDNGGSFP